MQSIRDWMEANPDQAKDMRRAEQVLRVLPHHRSCHRGRGGRRRGRAARARPVDRRRSCAACLRHAVFHPADLPIANEKAATKFDRLMIAQDTGSAIVGPARADIYFGAGDEAARIAGRIKNAGDFVMLLPRALDPVEAGRDTPLPPERPSPFGFNFGTMDDPTAPERAAADPVAADVRCRSRKPATAPG